MKNWQFFAILAAMMVINSNISDDSSIKTASAVIALILGMLAVFSTIFDNR